MWAYLFTSLIYLMDRRQHTASAILLCLCATTYLNSCNNTVRYPHVKTRDRVSHCPVYVPFSAAAGTLIFAFRDPLQTSPALYPVSAGTILHNVYTSNTCIYAQHLYGTIAFGVTLLPVLFELVIVQTESEAEQAEHICQNYGDVQGANSFSIG